MQEITPEITAREDRAIRSLKDTLHLMKDVQGNDQLAEPAQRIAAVVKATDIIDIWGIDLPAQSDTDQNIGVLCARSFRGDVGLLPATAFVFQATPSDTDTLPERTYEQRPG